MTIYKRTPVWKGLLIALIVAAQLFSFKITPVQSQWDGANPDHTAPGRDSQDDPLPDTAADAPPSPSAAQAAPQKVLLPAVLKNVGIPVKVTTVWTADTQGGESIAFMPSQSIRFYGKGVNTTGEATQAAIKWSLDGPCGSATLLNRTSNLASGTWTQYHTAALPDCTGIFTQTLQLTYSGGMTIMRSKFVVHEPSRVLLSREQAFDKCNIPTLSQMETWWRSSPYYTVNLYIGGISRACANSELDAVWTYKASEMGWTFLPTWVGPQAPCSNYRNRMSSVASTAYTQGRREAEAAVAASRKIGFLQGQTIYYDLEGYSGDRVTTGCRNTVSAFMRGWTERLHELGARSGVYGSGCTSYITDWYSNNPRPDAIWVASWRSPYAYNANASVYGASCLSDSLWANHQRVRQYAGDHRETWGGIAMTIDSNAVDGEVTALSIQGASARPTADSGMIADAGITVDAGTPEMAAPFVTQPEVQAMQLISAEAGWALVDGRLHWTDQGGAEWQEVTLPAQDAVEVLAAHFVDESTGWVVVWAETTAEISILRTTDGRATWQPAALLAVEPGVPVQDVFLESIDAQHGWVVLKQGTGSNFSQGMLLKTEDGGQSWMKSALPLGEPVRFVDPARGWAAGGPAGDEFYMTVDGGETWQPQELPSISESPSGQVFTGLPVFDPGREVLLPVTVADPVQPRVELFASPDGGQSWRPAATIPLNPQSLPSDSVPVAVRDTGVSILADPGSAQLYALPAEVDQVSVLDPAGLPEGVVEIEFAGETGWARVQNGLCTGYKLRPGEALPAGEEPFRCVLQSLLLRTADGGLTWTDVTP